MMNGDRKEGICRLNVDGNGCDYLRILSDLETKLRNNTNPKEKIELALQGALMFYGADRAYVIEVDDELGIGVNTYECCAPGIAPEIDNLQFMPFEMFPRWLCSLKSDTPIIITDLEQIKTEFLEEYRYLEKRSVNSLLAVPFQKRLNAGFLGVDNPKRNVEDPGFLRLVILCIVVELNEILLQEWRERRYASIKQPTIIQANLFGKLEIISATDVLKDDSFTNESGYVLLTFLLLNRKREDDIKLAMVNVSSKSCSVYRSVQMLYKCIFYSAVESKIIDSCPCETLSSKGGKPQNEREALTDEQVDKLLVAIKGLPPYVFVMIGLYAGLRREEILALKWDCVFLDAEAPYLSVQRAWHSEHNRPVISSDLKTKSARRDIPLPSVLTECLREAKEVATSEYVVANRDGGPLSYTQFKRVWQYIVTRSTKERTYVRYINGQKIQRTVTPKLGEKAAHNGNVVYTLDFQVTPHQLRHTYITNLIYSGADPKTVQYLAGHKHSKITMDIYAKVKYNKPKELSSVVNKAFAPKKGATPNKTRNG